MIYISLKYNKWLLITTSKEARKTFGIFTIIHIYTHGIIWIYKIILAIFLRYRSHCNICILYNHNLSWSWWTRITVGSGRYNYNKKGHGHLSGNDFAWILRKVIELLDFWLSWLVFWWGKIIHKEKKKDNLGSIK